MPPSRRGPPVPHDWSQQDVNAAEAENQRCEDENKPKKPGPSKEKK